MSDRYSPLPERGSPPCTSDRYSPTGKWCIPLVIQIARARWLRICVHTSVATDGAPCQNKEMVAINFGTARARTVIYGPSLGVACSRSGGVVEWR